MGNTSRKGLNNSKKSKKKKNTNDEYWSHNNGSPVPPSYLLHHGSFELFNCDDNIIMPRNQRYQLLSWPLPEGSLMMDSLVTSLNDQSSLYRFSLLSPLLCKTLTNDFVETFPPSLMTARIELSRHGFSALKDLIEEVILHKIKENKIDVRSLLEPSDIIENANIRARSIYLRGTEDVALFAFSVEADEEAMRSFRSKNNQHKKSTKQALFSAMMFINLPGSNAEVTIHQSSSASSSSYKEVGKTTPSEGDCFVFGNKSHKIQVTYDTTSSSELEKGVICIVVEFAYDTHSENINSSEFHYFETLPLEVQLRICSYLDNYDIIQLRKVSKSMKLLTEDPQHSLQLTTSSSGKSPLYMQRITYEEQHQQWIHNHSLKLGAYAAILREAVSQNLVSPATTAELALANYDELIAEANTLLISKSNNRNKKSFASLFVYSCRNLQNIKFAGDGRRLEAIPFSSSVQKLKPPVESPFHECQKDPEVMDLFNTYLPPKIATLFCLQSDLWIKAHIDIWIQLQLKFGHDYAEELYIAYWIEKIFARHENLVAQYLLWDMNDHQIPLYNYMIQIVSRETLLLHTMYEYAYCWHHVEGKYASPRSAVLAISGQYLMIFLPDNPCTTKGNAYLLDHIQSIERAPNPEVSGHALGMELTPYNCWDVRLQLNDNNNTNGKKDEKFRIISWLRDARAIREDRPDNNHHWRLPVIEERYQNPDIINNEPQNPPNYAYGEEPFNGVIERLLEYLKTKNKRN